MLEPGLSSALIIKSVDKRRQSSFRTLPSPATKLTRPPRQVYSCEYQLFIQQYFAICPSATEPIPFWPAPDNAPNRCSCSLGKVLSNTLSARNAQISCAKNITNAALNNIPDLSNPGNIPDIARTATDCACCGASASISAYVAPTPLLNK